MARTLLLLSLLAFLALALGLTKVEQDLVDKICQPEVGSYGLKPGASKAVAFPRFPTITCRKEMFEEEMDIPAEAILQTENHVGYGCFACVDKDWLDAYCLLGTPSDLSNYNAHYVLHHSNNIVKQEKGKTRLGKWVSSNDCNTCNHYGCTTALCVNVWLDKIYHC